MLHTFWVGNLRLVLDAVLTSGKQHTSRHGKAPLQRLPGELGDKAPALVRGDCGYGNEDMLGICEQRGLPYLLRLRQTKNVKRLIERLFRREDWTRASQATQSWQAIEDRIRLVGWSQARRVVVPRRRMKHDMALTARQDEGQLAATQTAPRMKQSSATWPSQCGPASPRDWFASARERTDLLGLAHRLLWWRASLELAALFCRRVRCLHAPRSDTHEDQLGPEVHGLERGVVDPTGPRRRVPLWHALQGRYLGNPEEPRQPCQATETGCRRMHSTQGGA